MELSTFKVGDRQFQITTQNHLSSTIYILESKIPLVEIDPGWESSVGYHWSDPVPDFYNIILVNQPHPFFEEEDLFLENVVEQKAAILKAIFTIQSLVAAGLL